ncbi:hypothetical protein FXO38_19589 [Capsicum annuum]|nr:hypothetical protein FXO38_19589 [Capsicum annuum]
MSNACDDSNGLVNSKEMQRKSGFTNLIFTFSLMNHTNVTLIPTITKAIGEPSSYNRQHYLTHIEFGSDTVIMETKSPTEIANVVSPTKQSPAEEIIGDDQTKVPEKLSGLFSQN